MTSVRHWCDDSAMSDGPQDALKAVEKIPVATNNAIHLSLLENYKVSHSTVHSIPW